MTTVFRTITGSLVTVISSTGEAKWYTDNQQGNIYGIDTTQWDYHKNIRIRASVNKSVIDHKQSTKLY